MDEPSKSSITRRRLLARGTAAAGALVLPTGLLTPQAFAAAAGDLAETDPNYGTKYLQTLHPFLSAVPGPERVADSILRNPRFKNWPTSAVGIAENPDATKNSGTVFLGPWRGVAHQAKGAKRGLQSAIARPGPGSTLRLEIRRPGTFYIRQYVPLGGAFPSLRSFAGKEFTLSADVELGEVNLYKAGAAQQVTLGAYLSYKFARTVGSNQNRQFILNTSGGRSEILRRASATDPRRNRAFLQSTFFTRGLPAKLPRADAQTGLEVALLISLPAHVSRATLTIRQLRLSRARNFNTVDTSS